MKTSRITHTHEFPEATHICEIIAIDDTHYLLAVEKGILKITKDQLINHYFKGNLVRTLCHVSDSLYLVGSIHQLVLWSEQTDQQLSFICGGTVFSIKRVMTTNNYVTKKLTKVNVVTINDFES
jgi:hypothetical protein